MTELFNKHGVIHQFSNVNRPQQNAFVERKHQHLLNVARAIYFQPRVPIKYWSEYILTSTYLINRTPSFKLQNKSPYELLYQAKVDYNSFRAFKCLAYASTSPNQRTKFQLTTQACVFIGYPSEMKGYKLLDIQNEQIIISHDVVFHEDKIPFTSSDKQNNETNLFNHIVVPKSSIEYIPETLNIDHDNIIPPIDNLGSITTRQDQPIIRRSTRTHKPPTFLKDYHCNLMQPEKSTTPDHLQHQLYPISNFISFNSLSKSQQHFTLQITVNSEQPDYNEAVKLPEWNKAMQSEIKITTHGPLLIYPKTKNP